MKTKITFIFICIAVNIFGQSPEYFTNTIDTSHAEIAVFNHQMQAESFQSKLSKQWANPEVSLSYFILRPETKSGPQVFGVSAYQAFPRWKKNNIESEIALQSEKVIAINREDAILQIKKSVLELYYNIAEIDEKIKNIDLMHKYLDQLKPIMQIGYENGKKEYADLLELEISIQEHHSMMAALVDLRNGYRYSLLNFCGLPHEQEVTTDSSAFYSNALSQNDSLEQNHPILLAQKQNLEIDQLNYEKQSVNGRPEFGIGLNYINVAKSTTSPADINGKDILMPHVKISIPLYRKKIKNSQAIAEVNKLKTESQIEATKRELERELKINQSIVESRKAEIHSNEKLIEQTEELLKIYEINYRENKITIDRLLNTQVKKFHIIEKNIELQKELKIAETKIKYLQSK